MVRVGKHRSDFLWYVLTGLLVLFAIGIYVVYVPESKRPDRKWAEFAFYSSFLFIFSGQILLAHTQKAHIVARNVGCFGVAFVGLRTTAVQNRTLAIRGVSDAYAD